MESKLIAQKSIPLSYSGSIPAINEEHVVLNKKAGSYEEALELILVNRFGKNKRTLKKLHERFLDLKPDNTNRELPGFVLNHLKTGKVQMPTLLMGIFPEGISHPSREKPVFSIVLLLFPDDTGFQQRMISIGELTSRLKQVTEERDITEIKDLEGFKSIFGQIQEEVI